MFEVLPDQTLIDQCENWYKKLNDAQKHLIKSWTQSSWTDFNNTIAEWLGGEKNNPCAGKSIEKTADFLLVLSTAPQFNGTLYRGTKKKIDQFAEGQIIDLKRLQSWTINPQAAEKFVGCEGFMYRVISGKGFYIDNASSYGRKEYSTGVCEDEVVVMPSKARVIGKTEHKEPEIVEKIFRTRKPRVYRLRETRNRNHGTPYRGYTEIIYTFNDQGESKARTRRQFHTSTRFTRPSDYKRNALVHEKIFQEKITVFLDVELVESWE